jgi:rhodanese-related sulfurtransferase
VTKAPGFSPVRLVLTLMAALVIARPAFASSLQSLLNNDPEPPGYNVIHVDDLVQLMHDRSTHIHLYDVNPVDVRAQTGCIPGAQQLASYVYDPSVELPSHKDATLVFYCRNTACKAADIAANRALLAGYTDVDVMADGIEGWMNAGLHTEPAN